jgi:NTE family protein
MARPPIEPDLKEVPFLKDVPARALRAAGREASWFSVAAGWPLINEGDAPDSICFVVSGSLGAFRTGADGQTELVGHIRAGEPVGEMALFAGEPHSASVYALRDTEIVRISRTGFERLVRAEPDILQRLIRLILIRTRAQGRRSARSEPRVFSLVATSPTIDLRLRAEMLAEALGEMGMRTVIIGAEDGIDKPSTWFDQLEREHDAVFLLADFSDLTWYRIAMRQADRLWVIARSDARPSVPLLPEDTSPTRSFRLVDVILLHLGSRPDASRTEEWVSAAGATRCFHWDGMSRKDGARVARVAAGKSVGLVLSGGGARAYAHIGVVKALRARDIPIDFVGGASMGAVVAACVAMDWDDEEIDWRIRKAFVESNPLGDFNLPVVGMVKGARVNKRLEEHFGDVLIEDLEMPFFAVSTNLSAAAVRIHRYGSLRKALRASISLPGILPPMVESGEVLVDGAVMNNFPVDVMRDMHRGTVIGCDVARQPQGLAPDEFINPPGFFGWVFRNGFSAAPPIADLLMRAATVTVNPNSGRELADMLVIPDLPDTELRDWKSYDDTVAAGYEATLQTLDRAAPRLKAASNPVKIAAE